MASAKVHHQTSTHMMKTTRIGRPFVKDIHELYATLVVSLSLDTHRYLFKQYPNTFTTDEAVLNLGSLKFSQSNRTPDPKDSSRIVTTTTTTTFSMTRDMAKSVCQHFMDARLFENAVDQNSRVFKDKGIFVLTPKGLHILERFITKNGISADHLLRVFSTQPICMKLLHLERSPEDDSIIFNRSIVDIIFRRFAGKQPNEIRRDSSEAPYNPLENRDTSLGIELKDRQHLNRTWKHTFHGLASIEWLCDYTTIVGREEAMEVGSQFFRAGLVEQIVDKSEKQNGVGATRDLQTFKYTKSALYHLTPEGRRLAGWEGEDVLPRSMTGSPVSAQGGSPSLRGGEFEAAANDSDDGHHKESNPAKLRQILEEPALRSLFKEFLRSNFCEENLAFWLDVQDLKRRFNTSSSAFGNVKSPVDHQNATEKHQRDLIALAFQIYNTYLAPASASELNIDHNLRHEMNIYMSDLLSEAAYQARNRQQANAASGQQGQAVGGPTPFDQLAAGQLQHIVKLYERIQDHIFRLMATDSVPKFIRTERFQALMRSMEEYADLADDFYGLNTGTGAGTGTGTGDLKRSESITTAGSGAALGGSINPIGSGLGSIREASAGAGSGSITRDSPRQGQQAPGQGQGQSQSQSSPSQTFATQISPTQFQPGVGL